MAAEARPVRAHQVLDRAPGYGEQVEPEQHRPQAVLLAHVAGTGAVALLAAQRGLAGVEQVAEELPAGGRLVAGDAEGRGDLVGGARGRHRARDAGQPGAIAGHQRGVLGERRQAVGWRDHEVAAEDHVAVGVAVRGRAEVGRVGAGHRRHQLGGVRRVGVGVVAAEVLQRLAVDHRAGGRAELALEDGARVRPAHRAHGVEAHAVAGGEPGAHGVEVEELLHQLGVVGDRVDHLDRHAAERARAERVEVDVLARVFDAVLGNLQAARVDRLGELLRGGAAVRCVVFDAEVALRPARVVAGRQDQAPERGAAADDGAHRRRRQQPAAAHQHLGKAVGRRHAQDGAHRDAVVEAAVAAQHQGLALVPGQGVEHRLDEVLEVVRLLEDGDLLAQSGGAGALAGEGAGGDGLDAHGFMA